MGMLDLLLDLAGEGWLPHPFVQHRTDKCAVCGATADRAVHDRKFARDRHVTWGAVLVSVPDASGSTSESGQS